ncbi:MAG: peptide-binding protein [Acidimicrobiaceae bacterium]|nr:peptide-binding protein [Acidimicrobiaceae bacterium]|tara:strand:+ start:602 stop:973 length:372 start_codon:yes stop_codon:yes gene_type:complete
MDSDEPTETYFIAEGGGATSSVSGLVTGFVVTEGPLAGSRFLLERVISTLGRHPKSDLFFDDITVSRRHAEIKVSPEATVVRDVGSLNGTYVNLLQIDEETVITPGDTLQIGKFKLVFFQETS